MRDFLAAMCNQRLEDPTLVISALEFRSPHDPVAVNAACEASSVMLPEAWDIHWEHEFALQLTKYLQGEGHPNHPDVRLVVGEKRFVRERHDPLLRARLFLHMMSGSDLVPHGSEWKLKVWDGAYRQVLRPRR